MPCGRPSDVSTAGSPRGTRIAPLTPLKASPSTPIVPTRYSRRAGTNRLDETTVDDLALAMLPACFAGVFTMRRYLIFLGVLVLGGCATGANYRYVDSGGGYYTSTTSSRRPMQVGVYGTYGYGWGMPGYWGVAGYAPFGYGYGWWPYPTYVHRPHHYRDRGDLYRESVRQAGAVAVRPDAAVPRDAMRPFAPSRAGVRPSAVRRSHPQRSFPDSRPMPPPARAMPPVMQPAPHVVPRGMPSRQRSRR